MWTHVAGNAGMGLEEQYLLRWDRKPVCALKPQSDGGWRASLLATSGIGTYSLVMSTCELKTAKEECESSLIDIGWRRPDSAQREPMT